ncbi:MULTISPECIES: peptidoglycan-binding domain-containing protein [Bacillus]|uniref:peptidoglycan-binding domain-containing protein n=1 Tax=Bacillus TaxID=1386 RepID=UPI001CEF904B|nr:MULTISPECIES: peptidoglycan-binding protein [Bacillus]MED1097441.1 peptidoglycan-binding protein [Bacillus capparidis]
MKVEAPKTGVKDAATSNPEKVLRKSSKGAAVKELQKKLIAAGFKLPKYGADGDYGNEVVDTVKVFQKAVGITADGIYGPVTDSKLENYKKSVKKKTSRSSVVPYPGHLIKRGFCGKDMERIQRAVGVVADGIYGPATERAVKAYQKRHSLAADGIVGPDTWNVMF